MADPIIKDAYEALKTLLIHKFSRSSEAVASVEKLEQNPDSTERKETLREVLAAAKDAEDTEILQAAQTLLEKIRAQPGGPELVQQTVTGNQNIFSGSGDVTVQFGHRTTAGRPEPGGTSMPAPEASQTVSGDHNIFTGTGDVKIVYELPPAEANERRSLLILLSRVRQFWIEGVLERSVYGAALLELGKERLQGAVEHPWERVLELPDDAPQQVPLDRSIVEVFHKSGRSLLIASEPGSGKTTTLLELARGLLTCAERDPSQPAPVVFNLSTWGEKRQRLLDWLVGELASKYYVPSRIGRAWLQDNRLLLMLDGLDEVKSEHRAGCVESINSFIQEFGVPGLAVCSRLSEYTALPVRLKLQGAVRLQLLTPDQVDAYLAKAGSRLESLRRALREDEVLQSLARTPLMLSIMSLAYQDQPVGALQGADSDTPESRRLRILETYVERMFDAGPKLDVPLLKGRPCSGFPGSPGKCSDTIKRYFLSSACSPVGWPPAASGGYMPSFRVKQPGLYWEFRKGYSWWCSAFLTSRRIWD